MTEDIVKNLEEICASFGRKLVLKAAENLGYFSWRFTDAEINVSKWFNELVRNKRELLESSVSKMSVSKSIAIEAAKEVIKDIKSEIISKIAIAFGCFIPSRNERDVDLKKTQQLLSKDLESFIYKAYSYIPESWNIIKINPIKVTAGLLNRSGIYALRLTHKSGGITDCFFKVSRISDKEKRMDYPNQIYHPVERLIFEQKNILFWKRHLLPTPYNYGFKEFRDTQTGDIYFTIISQNVPGPTCNQDGMTIDDLLKNAIRESLDMGGALLESDENIKAIRSLKEKLLKLSFRTINEFSLFGTYFLNSDENNLDKDLKMRILERMPKRDDYYKNKLINYSTLTYIQNLSGNRVSKDDVERLAKNYDTDFEIDCSVLPEDVQGDIEDLERIIHDLFETIEDIESPIKKALANQKYKRYVTGDESLLNFKIASFSRENRNISDPLYKAETSDADHCTIGNVLLSFVKTIADVSVNGMFSGELDHLLGRNTSDDQEATAHDIKEYRLVLDLLKEAVGTEELIDYDPNSLNAEKLNPYSIQNFLDKTGKLDPNVQIDFGLLFIYECICNSGRVALHSLIYPDKYETIINRIESYSPNDPDFYKTEFRDYTSNIGKKVNYDYYSVDYCFPLISNMVNAALTTLANKQDYSMFSKKEQIAFKRTTYLLGELFNKYIRPK